MNYIFDDGSCIFLDAELNEKFLKELDKIPGGTRYFEHQDGDGDDMSRCHNKNLFYRTLEMV